MNTPEISVIVPVYNTAERLPRCVASLCAQTMQDIEILLIDDGSTDKSGEICNQFAQKDARIQVFHKKNGGVSSARNIGLAQAKGKYISFVDSDDAVVPEMLAQLYAAAQAADAQVTLGAFVRVYLNGRQVKNSENLTCAVYHDTQIARHILFPLLGPNPAENDNASLESTLWRGLYRADLLKKDVPLQFEACVFSEDLIFMTDALSRCNCAATIDAVVYHYCINESSATERYRADKFAKMKESYRILQQHCKADGISEAFYRPRTAALFLSLASVCAKQICAAVPQPLSKTQAFAALAALYDDTDTQEAIARCKWQKLPLLLRIFCFCAKHHDKQTLYTLVRIFLKMQEIKK